MTETRRNTSIKHSDVISEATRFCLSWYNGRMEKIVNLLEDWYRSNKRDLPFRKNRDPYSVWVSEIMAQQTRIETMLPYYERWMARWPAIAALAQADLQDVLKMWEGLGYYNRARNLHKAAQLLDEENGGVFYADYEKILTLPGIGPYTAAAIASIVYDEKVPAIDGNVCRVVARLDALAQEISGSIAQKHIASRMRSWIQQSTPHIFTQAMMELGALVCTPQSPDCEHCPLRDSCAAHGERATDEYPVKKAKSQVPIETYDCYILRNREGKIALTLQNDDNLMHGYYRFPITSQLEGIELSGMRMIGKQKHVFSHKVWMTEYYYGKADFQDDAILWVNESELEELPMISAHRKFYQKQGPIQ